MRRLILRTYDHTHPLAWVIAVVCTILAVAVIIGGLIVLIVYEIYQPKPPSFKLPYARLNRLDYDQMGMLGTELLLTILADNSNAKAKVRFTDVGFVLSFYTREIAYLRADELEVPNNSSSPINYVVPSSGIPLSLYEMDRMDKALKSDLVPFNLSGQARTRWKVGLLDSVKFYTHLSCNLEFFRSNGSSNRISCSSAN